ncbi:hypothetical protein SK128_026914 [Halocaridina rubra]|uniref:Uncharacterized protein n=1 Tax=Halocaridina rubra TaxID=373956 RepID=A0AAN8WWX0_HALRR
MREILTKINKMAQSLHITNSSTNPSKAKNIKNIPTVKDSLETQILENRVRPRNSLEAPQILPAIGRRRPRFETHTVLSSQRKWAWAVFILLLGALPPPSSGYSQDEELRLRVESHTQSLMNMSRYLRQTDQFWKWFQTNEKALEALLAEGPSTRSIGTPSVGSLLQLEKRIDSIQSSYEAQELLVRSLREELEEEKQSKEEFKSQLHELKDKVVEQEEMLQTCQASVEQLEQNLISEQQLETLRATVNQHQNAVRTLQGMNRRNLNKLNQQENEIRRVSEALTTMTSKSEMEMVRVKMAELQMEVKNMEGHLSSLRQDVISEVDWSYQNVSSKLDSLVKGIIFPLMDDVEINARNLSNVRQIYEDNLLQRMSDIEQKISALSSRILTSKSVNSPQQLQNQIDTLVTSVSQLERNFSDLALLQNEITGLKVKDLDLETHTNSAITRLRSRLGSLERKSGEINTEQARLGIKLEDLEDRMYRELTDRSSNNRPIDFPRSSGSEALPPDYERFSNSGFPAAPGNTGNRGLPGLPGSPWAPGNSGNRGSPGLPGSPGAPGNSGNRGSPGIPGSPGAPGNVGNRGSPGLPGSPGAPGNAGNRGSPGLPGAPGNAGNRGSLGPSGPPGLSGYPGDRGSPGESGNAGIRGPIGQPGSPGNIGNRGSPGLPGNAGRQGLPGLPGDAGRRGLPGAPGQPGYRGSPGFPGNSGAPGLPGVPGDVGYPGNFGYGGYPGVPGYPGDIGSPGPGGPPGAPRRCGLSR